MNILDQAKTVTSSKNLKSKILGDISTMYLFGSQAKGKARSDSDIDIGVLLNENIPEKKYFDLKLDLIGEFSGIFNRNDIDVVILNNAPNILAMNVISEGKVIFSKDKKLRVAFECDVMRQYYDREYYEKMALHYLIKHNA